MRDCAQPKQKRVVDKKYLKWIANRDICCKCGLEKGWTDENGVHQGIIAHHQPAQGQSGKGIKVDDTRALPLCCYTIRGPGCHEEHDRVGDRTFWGDIDVEELIRGFNQGYNSQRSPPGFIGSVCRVWL